MQHDGGVKSCAPPEGLSALPKHTPNTGLIRPRGISVGEPPRGKEKAVEAKQECGWQIWSKMESISVCESGPHVMVIGSASTIVPLDGQIYPGMCVCGEEGEKGPKRSRDDNIPAPPFGR